MKYAIIVLCLMLSLSAVANAHLDNGKNREAGDYIIDFGYGPSNLTAGDKSIISVNLINLSNLTAVKPESVFVRISSPSAVEFSGTMQPDSVGNIALSYTFATGGEYEIDFRFSLKDNKTVESAFKIYVNENMTKIKEKPVVYSSLIDILSNPSFAFAIALVVVIQIIIGYFYLKK